MSRGLIPSSRVHAAMFCFRPKQKRRQWKLGQIQSTEMSNTVYPSYGFSFRVYAASVPKFASKCLRSRSHRSGLVLSCTARVFCTAQRYKKPQVNGQVREAASLKGESRRQLKNPPTFIFFVFFFFFFVALSNFLRFFAANFLNFLKIFVGKSCLKMVDR